ncbi:MAG: PadR family transcriptional regulator [Actinomycetota bacterium]
MLELAILGLLKERTMHGYQLSKRLTDTLGFWRVSYGSLYPTLRRLEQQGAVEKVFDEEVGRRKNVYRITEQGEKLFLELLEDPGADSGEENRFRVRLAFFKYLGPEARLRLLERRRAYLEERLQTIEASLAGGRDGADTYTLALMEHGQDSVEQDIAWLDDLIQAERTIAERAITERNERTTRTKPEKGGTKRRAQRKSARATALRGKERTT